MIHLVEIHFTFCLLSLLLPCFSVKISSIFFLTNEMCKIQQVFFWGDTFEDTKIIC